jgi:cation:H+ antiporter
MWPFPPCTVATVILSLTLLVVGLGLLTLAADRFVLSASRVSKALGLSPILVGALVIGLGTSAPEMLVSALAAGRGEIDLALGNVVGSNTANLTLVLGSTALVTPIVSRLRTVRREGALMLVSMTAFCLLLWNLELSRVESGGLLVAMIVAVVMLILWTRGDRRAGRAPRVGDEEEWKGSIRPEVWFGVGALAFTLLGADLLVRGASGLADDLGISSAFVGLVIVSIGTSLPELATALAAARRGQTDLVLGNVLGSNLFNTLAVAGIAGMVGPGLADETFHNAMVVMVIAGAVAGLFAFTGRRVDRWEGAMLLVLFLAFVTVSV